MTKAEFSGAFREHKDAVYGFAYRMTNSPHQAEDIAQDCFLALLAQSGRYDPARGSLRCFLIGIARNLTFKRWRAEQRWDPLDATAEIAVEPIDPAAAGTAELVARAVSALPPLQREALILAEYEGFSLKEIACMVEAEVGTVKARLHRARENLRHALAPLAPSAGAGVEQQCNR
jgi:RNA polymerase sigma-70 factor (ECF subfamily)